MNRLVKYFLLAYLLAGCLAVAETQSDLPKRLIGLSGRTAGICSMPRCGDGKLAVGIAQNSKLIVHAMSEQPAQVTAARKAAEDAGLLGRTVYVEEGGVAKNPLADWCADLLVIADASDTDLNQIAQKEVRRVLAPYRGVAVVGRAKALGAGLTKSALEKWMQGLDVSGGKIVEDESGLWAVVTMPPLAGADDWTHYAHGPDQNRYAKDDVIKWPYLIQWMGKPYYDGKFDMVAVAGGRVFRANATLAVGYGMKTDGLTARSAYNGSILWKKKLPNDLGTFGSLLVATPDLVYVSDGNGVLCLDAETGAERNRIVLSGDSQSECRWLMLQDGVLVTVLSRRPPVPEGKTLQSVFDALPREKGAGVATDEEKTVLERNQAGDRNWFQEYDQGTEIAAHDAKSGKELWRQAANRVDPAKTAIAGDRIFFYADRSYASCLDLKTGKTIWQTKSPILEKPVGEGWSITFMITERVGALASQDVYLINSYKDGHYQAFSAKDGSIRWGSGLGRTKVNEKLGGETYPVLVDGKIMPRDGNILDALTGKSTGEKMPMNYGGCGPFIVSTHGIQGMCGTVYNRDTKKHVPEAFMKAACLAGVIPADGLLYNGHGNCHACIEWLGHIALCSANGFPMHQAASAADRLRMGNAPAKPGTTAGKLDWTTYRANLSRSGSSAATIPSKGSLAWTWTPNPPFDYTAEAESGLETQSTQAICVGDRVYFGTATGAIRCLDRKTGKEVWNQATAGRIVSSPTFWEGKIFAGSGDGRVYCLNAEDGSLVWRFRVAPVERRIMVYGHLMSSWPVNANVLVHPSTDAEPPGAVAYASAGLIGTAGGTYVCALDARTGKLLWERPDIGSLQSAGDYRYHASGQMTVAGGKLWMHAGDIGVLAFDLKTGDTQPYPGERVLQLATLFPCLSLSRGQDIGAVSDRLLAFGGLQIYNDQTWLTQPNNTATLALIGEAGEKTPMPLATLSLGGVAGDKIPVWDADAAVVLGGERREGAIRLIAGLDELTAETLGSIKEAPKKAYRLTELRQDIKALPGDRPQIRLLLDRKSKDSVRAAALAKNAILVTVGASSGRGAKWALSAIARTDGTEMWKVDLPAMPCSNGLSISPVGDVLVALLDGQVVCIGDAAQTKTDAQ